jgi:transposase-like protein
MNNTRFICTKENPWDKTKGRASHPDAKAIGEQETGWPSGDIQRYKCPWCGLSFSEELPQ